MAHTCREQSLLTLFYIDDVMKAGDPHVTCPCDERRWPKMRVWMAESSRVVAMHT